MTMLQSANGLDNRQQLLTVMGSAPVQGLEALAAQPRFLLLINTWLQVRAMPLPCITAWGPRTLTRMAKP